MFNEREYHKKYRKNHKEQRQKYDTEYKRKMRGYPKRTKNEYSGLNSKDRLRAIRLTILRHYGGLLPCCACCGENEIKFLAIDHINGGGNKHRKIITKNGKGGNISVWLLRNNFPKGFQVLCHNCNMAKGHWGLCPHNT